MMASIGQSAPTEMRLMRYPAVHGDTVVFTYASDLWVCDKKGGYARRLTTSTGQEVRARISPDGEWVAFTGQYDGNSDVYVIPIDGGEPKRLTYEPDADNVLGWTPDGKVMYASTYGQFTNRQQRLWMVDPKGGMPIHTVVDEIFDGTMAADGKTLYYQRAVSSTFNWRRYRGGTQGRVSIYNLATNAYSELPSGREQSYNPMIVGNTVYYISDKTQGTLNLYKADVNTKKSTQLTNFSDADIKWPNTDGKTIVYERDGYLYTYDIASGKVDRMNPLVKSDNISARPYMRKLADQVQGLALSPSGVRAVIEARGDIFSVPATAGDTRNITNSTESRERFPEWSPDGKSIAYVSDATGDFEVYIQPQMGGNPTQLTSQKLPITSLSWSPDSKMISFSTSGSELYTLEVATKKLTKVYRAAEGVSSYDWSPDSKWIAYIDQGPNNFGFVNLYEVATGKSTVITNGMYDDSAVSFDMNGKYLYLISSRSFSPTFGQYEFSLKVENAQRLYVIPLAKDTPDPLIAAGEEEPEQGAAGGPPPGGGRPGGPPAGGPAAVKIDFDGLAERTMPLPMGPGTYFFALGANNGVFYYTNGALSLFSFNNRQSVPIMQGIGPSFAFNANRTKMAYLAGGSIGIVPVQPGVQPGQGRVDLSAVETIINPRDEWKQIYWEAWRFERDNFYDPDMRGLDWKAIGDRYAKYLPYVAHRNDLNYVLGLLLGELGTGHSYVSGGDLGPQPAPVSTGQIGADLEPAGDKVRIKKIYKGSNYDESRRGPLTDPGVEVKEGDYLLEIDGKPVTSSMDPNSLLVGKANRLVVLTVNSSPSMVGSHKIHVRTVGSEGNLRYNDWVEANRAYVTKMSGGRIGYMHIPDTQTAGAIEFIRGYYSQTDKDAVIVDERWNGGGYIQPWFVDTLARKIKAGIQSRNGLRDNSDAVAIEGPKALLINQYAGSGGDFFPWMFRQAKLGPLIGKRTWGGLVGIGAGAPLVDGGSVTAPSFSIYDRSTNEIIAENRGIDPDIDVDLRPDLVAQGKDPQLDKALEVLMEQVRKLPAKPKRERIPQVGKDGRVPPQG